VATGTGMALVLLPVPTVVLAVVWVAVTKGVGAASAGSLAVAAGLPVAAVVVGRPDGEVIAFAACGVLVAVRHWDNLGRLRTGQEPPLLPQPSDPGPTGH
jgi:acyl phosphate:glycerol-3-phosphate acyltransferase